MRTTTNRREFLKNCSALGFGCAACMCLPEMAAEEETDQKKQAPDPKKFEYCGYKCPDDCEMRKATSGTDEEKKVVFEKWGWAKKFGVEFDPKLVFCYTCKNEDKPKNLPIQKCEVRACAIDRKLDSCIQCKQLEPCEKPLWTRYPEFKKQVLTMQKEYVEATGAKLI
ncbi:DUF3795 domain-containing protein [candidate division KSB1 bacterium]|nr:DUF3795 domain-containing protein [candidate division KSB1 bacterium]